MIILYTEDEKLYELFMQQARQDVTNLYTIFKS